ncbi:MAG: hypothetical protein NTY74_10855 [Ignavibacteriae bacterium]|nr:hypothetical protein [Ignavibacteriota bacterium]
MTTVSDDLFVSGNILFVKDYEFEDSSKKDKLLIVLYASESDVFIIQSLTTSKDKTYSANKFKHGCNQYNSFTHFYFFDKDKVIGSDNSNTAFKFNLDTFVYFNSNVKKIPTTNLLKYKGGIFKNAKLTNHELKSLLTCMVGSILIPKAENDILSEFLKVL